MNVGDFYILQYEILREGGKPVKIYCYLFFKNPQGKMSVVFMRDRSDIGFARLGGYPWRDFYRSLSDWRVTASTIVIAHRSVTADPQRREGRE